MPLDNLRSLTGVSRLRTVGQNIVVEYQQGWARPATALEIALWGILAGETS